jgi:predicted tellurium resistance membrane protein TerC
MDAILALLAEPQTYISLLTLFFLELVLGVDNIIFIAILAGKLPKHQQQTARVWGLSIAILGRIALLLGISWLAKLTAPLITLADQSLSGRDLILLGGGLFLIYKSAQEIYEKVELKEEKELQVASSSFGAIVGQIIIIDMVFSLDSIITAVGLVNEIPIMVTAILLSLIVMIAASGAIADVLDRHPSLKILGLSFLLMIGVVLTAEAFGTHVPRGYVYTALAFTLFVEWVNITITKQEQKKQLRDD